MAKCTKSYGSACEETAAARAAQNAECNPKPMKNIVELAESVDSLSTLVAAVVAGDLVATLSSPGPFTVFAPTNDAFNALPAGTLDSLMKPENKATLVDILTYHVVGAAALSTDLSDGQMIGTVEGKSVTVHIGDGIKINDATVVMADVMASNGVVHVVDGVLLPPSRESSTGKCCYSQFGDASSCGSYPGGSGGICNTDNVTPCSGDSDCVGPTMNIVELAQSVDTLSTLVAAVVAGDLVTTLSSPGPFTVFAPTNVAFAALPAGTLDALLKPENKATLVDILTYHVVGAVALSTDLSDGQVIATVEGKSVTVHIGDGIKINDATVVMADVMATNGVVHVVDGVLLPPAPANGPTMNIVELAQARDWLSTLVEALVAGDLVRTLSSEGPFTVFAPTNDAFDFMPAGTLDTLLKPENKAPLVDILTYHVLIGQVLYTDLIASHELATVEGKILKVTNDASGVKVGANLEASVEKSDDLATNGVVHIIDVVMFPPSAIVV